MAIQSETLLAEQLLLLSSAQRRVASIGTSIAGRVNGATRLGPSVTGVGGRTGWGMRGSGAIRTRAQNTKSATTPTTSSATCVTIIESESRQRGVSFHFRQDATNREDMVRADAVMLERVILNLVTNALEAMAASDEAHTGQRLELAREVEHRANSAVLAITVTDNGPGLVHAGDPSPLPTSTKPQGMGIGLLWVRLLIEQWGGEFRLENRPTDQGHGAVATIRLPLRAPA